MNDNPLGVFASFSSDPSENDEKRKRRETQKDQFKEYLWGVDGDGGLSKSLKHLRLDEYGQDIKTILLQFDVNPVQGWPQPKEIENYRSKEKSIGVWITISDDYFLKDSENRRKYVKMAILNRLEELKKRFTNRKLDINMDKLIKDVDELLA